MPASAPPITTSRAWMREMASLTGSGYAFILHVDLVCKGEEVFKILHPSPHQMLTDHCDSESIRVDRAISDDRLDRSMELGPIES